MSRKREEEPQFFVSRRGKQVGVHELNLDGIDIEKQQEPAAESVRRAKNDESKPEKKPVKKQFAQEKHWNKKRVVIVATIVIVLVAIPLIVAESVTASYARSGDAARKRLAETAKKYSLMTTKKSTLSSEQISAAATDVNNIAANMCKGGLVDNIAGIYPRAKSALASCQQNKTAYSRLSTDLFTLQKQASYLEKVDVALEPAAAPVTDAYAVIGDQLSRWKTASDTLNALTPPDTLRTAHSELASHVKQLSEGWSRLNTANNEQNASDFTEAEEMLNSRYEALRALSPQFNTVLNDTQSKVTATYNSIRS